MCFPDVFQLLSPSYIQMCSLYCVIDHCVLSSMNDYDAINSTFWIFFDGSAISLYICGVCVVQLIVWCYKCSPGQRNNLRILDMRYGLTFARFSSLWLAVTNSSLDMCAHRTTANCLTQQWAGLANRSHMSSRRGLMLCQSWMCCVSSQDLHVWKWLIVYKMYAFKCNRY
jgi:hypothetical protein